MRFRYYFCEREKPELIDFLKQNQIKYKISGNGSARKANIIFNIYSDGTYAEWYIEQFKQIKVFPLVYTEYSEEDRLNAKLLWLWPKSQKIDIINENEAYDFLCEYRSAFGHSCHKHEVQKGLIAIAKEPATLSKNCFWTISTGFSELFVSRRVYEAVQNSPLKGVQFLNVILKNGDTSDNLFQMVSPNIITRDCIEIGHGEIIERCCVCGAEQYSINSGEYQLHLDISKLKMESDFYMTERIFGAGITEPLYVISQSFYRLLKENGLTGGAQISPVYVSC